MSDDLLRALERARIGGGADGGLLDGRAPAEAPQSDTVWRAGALARVRGEDAAAALAGAGVEVSESACADGWKLAYEPSVDEVPESELDDAAAARADWWRRLASSDDVARMRAASVLRGEVAAVAAQALARAWAEYVEAERQQQGDGGGEGEGGGAAAGEREARAAAAVRGAARAAAAAADSARALSDALGCGAGAG
ncbi:MAG: hypothetical protein N2688_11015, partial [Burkholderiaceae bacterium]|nr:hypothetical protein [Burkholderiaceae bacterium]